MRAHSAKYLMIAAMALSGCGSVKTESQENAAAIQQKQEVPSEICAQGSATGDAPICVSHTNAFNVWSNAIALKKTLPIQMWVTYPDDNLDSFVANKAEIDAWFLDVKNVLDFLSAGNAESYAASMKGKLGDLVTNAKKRQDQLLAVTTNPGPTLQQFKDALTAQAEATTGPMKAALADDKAAIVAVTDIVTNTKIQVRSLHDPYYAIAARYKEYKDTEAAEISEYTQLSLQGAATTLDTLPAVQAQVLQTDHRNGSLQDQLVLDATRLRATFAAIGVTYRAQLAPYLDHLARTGANRPDLTSEPMRSLDNMVAYVETRTERNNALAARLLDELSARRQVLIQVAADDATRDTIAQAKLLQATRAFLDMATGQTTALWAAPMKSTKLGLPFLAARYDSFTSFMQLQALCSTGVAGTWRETGCNALNQQFPSAQTYLQKTLPGQIKLGVILMNGKGPSAAALADITNKLNAGTVKAAAAAYDEALRVSDGTVAR